MTPRHLLLTGVVLAPLFLGAAVPDSDSRRPHSSHVADVPVEIGPRKLPAGSAPTRVCAGAGAHCCGDGIIDPGEECDDAGDSGPADVACRADCTLRRCGDGIVDVERGEQCDRGDLRPGDGCSARCFLEPSPTARMAGGRGPRQTECVIAWKLEGTGDAGTGPAAPRQACIDGDPRCDRDGAPDGRCRFYVWLCSNNSKPSELPCRPGAGRDGVGVVALAEVRKPTARDAARQGVDAENYRQLLAAAAAAPVGSNADVCGPRIEIQVPTRTGRRGARSIRLRATSNRNAKDADALKLVCLPPGSPGPVAHATVAGE